ncbi:hypothetical protein ABD74_10750 [Brevibacillus laterosporus]|nr:hypothetical protein [Brevibacillus laterosporus]
MIFKNKAIQVESLQHLLFLYASSITAPGVYARKSGNAMYRGKKHPKEWMLWSTIGFGLFYVDGAPSQSQSFQTSLVALFSGFVPLLYFSVQLKW